MKIFAGRKLLPSWYIGLLLLILLISGLAGAEPAEATSVTLKEGEVVPPLEFRIVSGKTASLGSLIEGKEYLVIVFWGVNCIPCLGEIEQLNREWEDPRFRQRSRMIAVNTDGLDPASLRKEMASKGIEVVFPVVSDEDHRITDMFVDRLIPLTVLIGRDRTVRRMLLGGTEDTVKRVRNEVLTGTEKDR